QKGRILFLGDRDVRQERHGSRSDARLPTALRHLPGGQELGAPRPLVARAVRKQAHRTAQQRYRVWMLPIDGFQPQAARQLELEAVAIAPGAGNSGEASGLGRAAPELSVDFDASAACPAGDPQAERELLRLRRAD